MKNAILKILLIISFCSSIEFLNVIVAGNDNMWQVGGLANEVDENEARNNEIVIRNQRDFDQLNSIVNAEIVKGKKEISVYLMPGKYYFKNKHLSLQNIINTELSITVHGDSAFLIGAGAEYTKPIESHEKEAFVPSCRKPMIEDGYISDNYENIDLFSETKWCLSQVEVVDESKKLCRVKTTYRGNPAETSVLITSWYRSFVYEVAFEKDGYLYFIANNLLYRDSKRQYNVNMDYGWAKELPRYKLFNEDQKYRLYLREGRIHIPPQYRKVYLCTQSNFLMLKDCNIKHVKIEGISFIGNNASLPLLFLRAVKSDGVIIKKCTFKYIRSNILKLELTDNVQFDSNYIERCYEDCVVSLNGCKNTAVSNCFFYQNGLRFHQHNCVLCNGEEFHIYNNMFCNFTYSAIRVGVHYSQPHTFLCNGIIENNEIWYDSTYINDFWKYTLMDSGAIYVATINDGTIVRNNCIHDYTGMSDNRGIFCDDGTGNVMIYGNLIYNISNSYTIDLRRTHIADNKWNYTNSNNYVGLNLLCGNYRFEGRNNHKNVLESNVVLKDKQTSTSIVKDVFLKAEDVTITDYEIKDGRAKIGKVAKDILKERNIGDRIECLICE